MEGEFHLGKLAWRQISYQRLHQGGGPKGMQSLKDKGKKIELGEQSAVLERYICL